MASETRLIKYSVEHYIKEGVSKEEFLEFINTKHLPVALPLMKKHGIVRYAINERDPATATDLQSKLAMMFPTWVVSDADYVLEYWMPSLDSLIAVVMDPDWAEKAVKNQESFIDMSKSTVHVGFDSTLMEDGNILHPIA